MAKNKIDVKVTSERKKTMEMCYNGNLVMPKNYAVVDNDEMEYIDGGASFSRAWIAVVVDVAALAICPYLAPVKYLGKSLAKSLVKKFLPKLAGAFSKILSTVLGLGINISTGKLGGLIFDNLWCLTSVGGIVALAADYFSDNSVDNKVTI